MQVETYRNSSLHKCHEQIIQSLKNIPSVIKRNLELNYLNVSDGPKSPANSEPEGAREGIVYCMLKMLTEMDQKLLGSRFQGEQKQWETQPQVRIIDTLSLMNETVPNVIRRLSESNRSLGLVCEGLWKFLVALMDSLISDISTYLNKQIEVKFQELTLQMDGLRG